MRIAGLSAGMTRRLIQRIANFTVGSLIATLFVSGAGVGVGVLTAPAANAAAGAAVLGSISVDSYALSPAFSSSQPNYSVYVPSNISTFTFSANKSGSSNPTLSYIYDTTTTVSNISLTGAGYTSASLSIASAGTHVLLVNSINGTNKFTYTLTIYKSTSTTLNRPETPTALTGVPGNGSAQISWIAPQNIGTSAISNYSVQYATTNAGPWTDVVRTASSSTTQLVSGLSNGQTYYFRVAAINASGTGPFTSSSSGYTPAGVDNTPPVAPTNLYLDPNSDSGRSSNDAITVNTTLVISGISEANSSVQLFIAGIATGSACTTNSSGVFTCTSAANLSDGVKTITAKATDAAGNASAASSTLSVTVDNVAPIISSTVPANAATGVALNEVYTINFNEKIAFGTGAVLLTCTNSGCNDDKSFNADGTSSSDGIISGDLTTQIIINPSVNFTASKNYEFSYATTAFTDVAGNALASVTKTFTTSAAAATVISKPAITGVTVPVRGATPVASIAATDSYTATIAWSPNDATFLGGTAYTATVTLVPKSGYTLAGVAANFFTISGATTTNAQDSGLITAVFPATAATTIVTPAIAGVTLPATGAMPTASITDTDSYTATISWDPNNTTFAAGTVYTATITLTPKTGYTLTGVTANFFTVSGATTTNTANSGVITAVFPATSAATISAPAISGITAPVRAASPTATISATDSYTATISWSPNDSPFLGGTIYTATITLTPKTGYTLSGVNANFFTVAGATSTTNSANSGVVTAVFPATSESPVSYSISSSSASPTSGPVNYDYVGTSTQTTITLNRSGNSGSNPTTTISVSSGDWTLAAGTNTSVSATSITSARAETVTLTATSGTVTLYRNSGANIGSETATVHTSTPTIYVVTVSADVPDSPAISDTSTADSSFIVRWNRPVKIGSGAISTYTIGISPSRADSVSSINVPSTGASTESYTVTGLTNGTVYTFTVTATNNGGRTSVAANAVGKPSRVPSAPVTPTVTIFTDTATVSWGALSGSDTGGESISYYTIEESSTATSGVWTLIETTTATSIERSGLTGRSNISYRISATNVRGQSNKSSGSAPVSPGKKNHTLSTSPASTSGIYKSASEIDLVVTSSDSDFSGDTLKSTLTYTLSGDANVCEVTADGKVKAYTGSGARAGTCIVTVNSSGNVTFNGANTARTLTFDSIEPNDPETSTVTSNSSSVSINWNEPTEDGGKSISTYAIYYKLASDPDSSYVLYSDTLTARSQSISGLLAATDYTFKLKAKNADNKSSSGRVISTRTSNVSKSARSLSITGAGTTNYGQAVSLGSSGGSGTTIRWRTTTPSICSINESGTVTSLLAGTCSVVIDSDEDDTYAASSATTDFVFDAIDPDAPTLSDPISGEEQITLSWTAPSRKGGAASITTYTVTSSPAGFGCTTSSTSCVITGLDATITYTFTITATSSSSKTSAASSAKSAKPNAKAASTPSTPAREPSGPSGPSTPQEPTKVSPKPLAILPPVALGSNSGLPSAGSLPSKGKIPTIKDGKEEVAELKVSQQVTAKSSSSTSVVTKAEVAGENWGVTVLTAAAKVSGSTSAAIGTTTPATQVSVVTGSNLTAQGKGFAPRTNISVYVFSDPIYIGKIRTDGYGNFKGLVKLPADFPEGTHTLQLNGYTSSLEIRTASLPIKVLAKQVAAKPTATPTPTSSATPEAKAPTVSFTVNFAMNSWWVGSDGYNAIRAAMKKVPAGAANMTVAVVGNVQHTNIDPYPNIGLDRAKAVVKAMRSLGVVGKYTATQSDKKGKATAEYRRADVTITWSTS